MREVLHHVGHPQELAAGAAERVRFGVVRAPLRDHVVVRALLRREPRRHEVGRLRVTGGALAVHRVEEPVAGKLGMEGEADEAALEPTVNGVRERRGHVGVHRDLAARDQIEIAAGVVRETPAVRHIAYVAHACPTGRIHVLVRGQPAARLRQPYDVYDPHLEAALLHGRRQRVGDERLRRGGGCHADGGGGERRPDAHAISQRHGR